MRLPENAIGPTDVREYGDCPRRFEFGMRRHTEAGESPEAIGPSNAYGSAVHDALSFIEEHEASDEAAIQHAFDKYGPWLDPEHLERLREDIATYREREPTGVRTVAVEREVRMPLFEHNGEMIFLRGKLDRLYQRLDNEAVFVHVDYKSSAWPKTEKEVHDDLQLWTYNLLIHEEWPECETLVQLYDQLSHGVHVTRKSEDQRALMRDYLIAQITAILNDEKLAPKLNRWCAWCPIMESCPIVTDVSDYALGELAALAPAVREGRKTTVKLDPARFEVYVAQLEHVSEAGKVLERYEKRVKEALKLLPAARRAELGYRIEQRMVDSWPAEALRAVHGVLGDEDFYHAIGLSKTALDRIGKDDPRVRTALGMATRSAGATVVRKVG